MNDDMDNIDELTKFRDIVEGNKTLYDAFKDAFKNENSNHPSIRRLLVKCRKEYSHLQLDEFIIVCEEQYGIKLNTTFAGAGIGAGIIDGYLPDIKIINESNFTLFLLKYAN